MSVARVRQLPHLFSVSCWFNYPTFTSRCHSLCWQALFAPPSQPSSAWFRKDHSVYASYLPLLHEAVCVASCFQPEFTLTLRSTLRPLMPIDGLHSVQSAYRSAWWVFWPMCCAFNLRCWGGWLRRSRWGGHRQRPFFGQHENSNRQTFCWRGWSLVSW